ncbi:MAG: hypothetical protein ACC707_05750 [Thiohalomonadales bacterium]
MSRVENSSVYYTEVIESFRLGREGQGSAALRNLINLILPTLEKHKAEIAQDDILLLSSIIAAQERGDYLYVADLLEYQFPRSIFGKLIAIR